VTTGGFSSKRLARVRGVLERSVDSGFVPGAVAVVARHGEVYIEATGTLAFEGAGPGTPMAADTICRLASMTKPVVAACAMTLVEDCTLRLDDPVDEFLPELADMRVLADPDGPLVVAGLASARLAAVMAIAWLPGAAVQPLAWYFIPFPVTRLDAWYLVSWLAWLAIAVLTLAEARSWRSGNRSQSAQTPEAADTTGPSDA
jgi:Beta-lactamase